MSDHYSIAKKIYSDAGIDSDSAIEKALNIPLSIHCWQGDDVVGLDGKGGVSGGIQTTGNYPGRAGNFKELTDDLSFAFKLIPGKKRLNLHASYAVLNGADVDRDGYLPEHFAPWAEFAKKEGLDGIDFNPTLFGHDMMKNGMTLSSPDKEVKDFWIRHCKASLKISEYLADETGSPVLMNIWIPDGLKDLPADRLAPRKRLKEALDEILDTDYSSSKVIVAVESKVFGIGVESYTVGSNEFYQNYAAQKGICCLLDNGHYHPTECVSDKIPALLAFYDTVALHLTRGVRWDSDHVVRLDDELIEICKEIIRNGAENRVKTALDYFDASINRIAAWAVGARNVRKAFLIAALQPYEYMKKLQDECRFTELLALGEEIKSLPFGLVWEKALEISGVPGSDWLKRVESYEKDVLSKRV